MAIIKRMDQFSDQLFDYSLKQFASTRFLAVENDSVSLKPNYRELLDDDDKTIAILNFWIIFSVAFECLVKAVLIRHEKNGVFLAALSFERDTSQKPVDYEVTGVRGEDVVSWSYDDGVLSITRDYFKQGTKVEVQTAGWLQGEFSRHGYEYLRQVRTCNLGNTAELASSLMRAKGYENEDADELEFAIRHLTATRRNRDLHCYFGEAILINNNDLPGIYLPAVNRLIELFRQ